MSKTVSFSMSEAEYLMVKLDATVKGMTPSQYAKTATFAYLNRYAAKGILSEYYRKYGLDGKVPPAPMDLGAKGTSGGCL